MISKWSPWIFSIVAFALISSLSPSVAVAQDDPNEGIHCPKDDNDMGMTVPDMNGDGQDDFKYDSDNPNYCLVCLTSGVPYFMFQCGGIWVHRCPYVGGRNEIGVTPDGKYRSSSTEGGSDDHPDGQDADGDGVVEKICYEMICLDDGSQKMRVTVKHDGMVVGMEDIDPPTDPNDLPWPDDVEPVPPQGGGAAMNGPWLIALFAAILMLVARRFALSRRSESSKSRRRLAFASVFFLAIGFAGLLHDGYEKPAGGARSAKLEFLSSQRPASAALGFMATFQETSPVVTMAVSHNILEANPNPGITKGLEVRVTDSNGDTYGGVIFPWYDPRASYQYGVADLGNDEFLLRVQPGAYEKFFLLQAVQGGTCAPVSPDGYSVDSLNWAYQVLPADPPLTSGGASPLNATSTTATTIAVEDVAPQEISSIDASYGIDADGPTVLINELRIANQCWFAIANLDETRVVDLAGWSLAGHWDNPANGIPEVLFTFPANVTLGPLSELVIEETAGCSGSPIGTQTFTLPAVNPEGGNGVPWYVGESFSIALYDDHGNGVDYVAVGVNNEFDCPRSIGTGVDTDWDGIATSGAVPVLGGLRFPANGSLTYRHQRVDTDSASDFTNTTASNATPGGLNHFQAPPLSPILLSTPMQTSFAATAMSGCTSLVVGFTNTSTGSALIEPSLGASIVWDFDAVQHPGTQTAHTWHASHTFTSSSVVTLTIIDHLGNASASAPMTISINGLAPTPRDLATQELFEAFPPLVTNPCDSRLGPQPMTGWEHTGTGDGRLRVVDSATLAVPFAIGAATPRSGTSVAVLDSASSMNESRLVLHFDGTKGGTQGFRIRYSLFENQDESDPEDVVALVDGITPGERVEASGAYSTAPGHAGLREMLVLDWNTANDAAGGSRLWHRHEHVVTYSQFVAAGLSISPNMGLVFRQVDDGTFENDDGLLVDHVEIVPEPPIPGPGQPCIPGVACLDINGATNGNFNPVGTPSDLSGPHFASAASGILSCTISGEIGQSIIVFGGNLDVFAIDFPLIGQIDVSPVVILSDGLTLDGPLPQLFQVGPNGESSFVVNVAGAFPPGAKLAIQCAILNSAPPFVGLSNAVEVTF